MYGQTEATARMAILPAADLPRKLGSAGRAIPGGSFQIRRDDGSMASQPREQGELVYSGPNVMMGYATRQGASWRRAILPADTWKPATSPVSTKKATCTSAGACGATQKSRGLRINLDEVEGMLKGHGAHRRRRGK